MGKIACAAYPHGHGAMISGLPEISIQSNNAQVGQARLA
jgi:hypothetical protein